MMTSNKILEINFVSKMKRLFPNYDYSQIDYKGSKVPVKIICPEHGEFEIIPNIAITYSRGCPECQGIQNHKMTTQHFILKSEKIHGKRFEYSKTTYVNMKTPTTIFCYKHGEFQTLPQTHLRSSNGGCPLCNSRRKLTFEEIKERLLKIYGNKYDFTNTNYVDTKTPITYVCKDCGHENTQVPANMLSGFGCKWCSQRFKNTEQFLVDARKEHGNTYDYSKSEYLGAKTNVTIICPLHGEFEQLPQNHTVHGMGCPKCAQEKLSKQTTSSGENKVYNFLVDKFPEENIIPNFRLSPNSYELDIYIESLKLGIEYNGIYWHSEKIKSSEYHYNKKRKFEALGIRVLMIWESQSESEWKKEIEDYIQKVSSKKLITEPGVYDYDKYSVLDFDTFLVDIVHRLPEPKYFHGSKPISSDEFDRLCRTNDIKTSHGTSVRRSYGVYGCGTLEVSSKI